MGRLCSLVAVLVAVLSTSDPGLAATETILVAATASNLKNLDFDPSMLTRAGFYDEIVPIARRESSLTLYSFAPSYPPFWKRIVIPAFEQRYGIEVRFFEVNGDAANQQILAARSAHRDSPVDVYFASGTTAPAILESAGVLAHLPLYDILPEAAHVDEQAGRSMNGFRHGGIVLPMSVNQTGIGYLTPWTAAAERPRDFDGLLAFALTHPGKVAVTSPLKGGSGLGFLISVASRFMTGDCRRTFNQSPIDRPEASRWVRDSGCLAPVWAYMDKLLAVSELTNSNGETIDLIASGQVLLGTVIEDSAFNAVRQKRLPAGFRQSPLEPGSIGGADALLLAADAKAPAAALLFIDFALSRDIQLWKWQNMASRSARTDVAAAADADPAEARFLMPSASMADYRIGWPAPAISAAILDAFERDVLPRL